MTGPIRELTIRQRAVLELLAKRRPYKVIAAELGMSETRVKQHVRLLKERLDANSMSELVDRFDDMARSEPFPKREGRILEGASLRTNTPKDLSDDPGEIQLTDSFDLEVMAPWLQPEEPKVVPGVLNGGNAALRRFLAILGLTAGLFALVALSLTAAQVLSDVLSGVDAAPVEKPK